MNKKTLTYVNVPVRTYSLNTVVVGTGAAGFNATLRLTDYDVNDIAVVTEGVNVGTSRNTGSDKQTYYKMNLCADYPDSPKAMAQDLFNGKCVDGDIAYSEAALSVMCFLHLAELGVPFPVNQFGEYVGYKTDHDPRARATSAGPLTSKLMTECLEKEVTKRKIKIFNRLMVVSVIKDDEKCCGLLALDLDNCKDEKERFVLFNCKNVIFATGGPAAIYSDTVYPYGHHGSNGVLFEAGVKGKNLTEWQYGLASVNPRWNVSGTYMQVLPKFVSVDSDGTEHEFLKDYFNNDCKYLSEVFKKGYEWPFDCRKAISGSSIIDLLVYRETKSFGRKVYLDYTENPCNLSELPYEKLAPEAYEYLKTAEACFGTPIERLVHMNSPAVDLYLQKGIDLSKQRLEIALCAQHNNGGVSTDMWWQTNVKGLFAAGEAVGTHGIYRPGGSALNSGQVGSTRSSQYISQYGKGNPMDVSDFAKIANITVVKNINMCRRIFGNRSNVKRFIKKVSEDMSKVAGAIRNTDSMQELKDYNINLLNDFEDVINVSSSTELYNAYLLRDILNTQIIYLTAMQDYKNKGGKSRGSALYVSEDGESPDGLNEFRFKIDNGSFDEMIQEVFCSNREYFSVFRPVRPLPDGGGFFENVWRKYRENKNIF